jgi:hypothetical protein
LEKCTVVGNGQAAPTHVMGILYAADFKS